MYIRKIVRARLQGARLQKSTFVAQDIMFNAQTLLSLKSLILIRELVEQDSSLVYK
ncbi:MAG: hypothetical protein P8X73_01860 [Ignavibacteriaceae bacterium]